MANIDPDTMTPQEFLENRQKSWAAHRGIQLDSSLSVPIPEWLNQLILSGMGKEVSMFANAVGAKDARSYLPDKFPLNSSDGALRPLIDQALKLLDPAEREIVQDVPIGITHVPWLNAARISVPAGGHIIEFNYALFCGLNISFREMLWVIQNFFAVQFISDPQQIRQRYVDIFLPLSHVIRREFLYETHVPFHFRKIDDPMSGAMAGSWSICAQLFVLLHELAHVVLAHDDVQRPSNHGMSPAETEVVTRNHKQEFEADEWAASKIRQLPPGLPTPVSVEQMKTALSLLFYVFEIALTLCPGQFKDETTHPRPLDRFCVITQTAFDLEAEELPQVDDLMKVYSAFEQVSAQLT